MKKTILFVGVWTCATTNPHSFYLPFREKKDEKREKGSVAISVLCKKIGMEAARMKPVPGTVIFLLILNS
jgi:hypothetical protein